jgi:hypothetical protein
MANNRKGPLERAEDLLKDSGLWARYCEEGGVGRTWGKRYKDNHCATPGSQICLHDGQVALIIYSAEGKQYHPIEIKRFGESDLSTLEKEVTEALSKAGLLEPTIPA